jgi:hypothetical protein
MKTWLVVEKRAWGILKCTSSACMHQHTHTHTHSANAHTKYTCTHTQNQSLTGKTMHTRTYAAMHTNYMSEFILIVYTSTHTYTLMHVCAHTCTHTYTHNSLHHIRLHTHIHTHAHTVANLTRHALPGSRWRPAQQTPDRVPWPKRFAEQGHAEPSPGSFRNLWRLKSLAFTPNVE